MPSPCGVSPCGSAGRVSSSSVWRRCCGWWFFSVPHWSDLTLDWVDHILGLSDLVRLVSLPYRSMDIYSSSLPYPGAMLLGWVMRGLRRATACPTEVVSLLHVNVVNRAKSNIQVGLMVICSFYIKTNIVIPTCMSDNLPPVLPSYQCVLMMNWWVMGWYRAAWWVTAELPTGGTDSWG